MPYYRPRVQRRTRRGRSFTPARQNEWIRSASTYSITGGSGGVDLIPATAIDRGSVVGATVVRTHLSAEWHGATITSPYGGIFVGICIVPNYAGAAPSPSPVADGPVVDWMWWKYYSLAEQGFGGWTTTTETSMTFEIDCKSKRRLVGPQSTCVLTFQINSVTPPFTQVQFAWSTLLKLG